MIDIIGMLVIMLTLLLLVWPRQ